MLSIAGSGSKSRSRFRSDPEARYTGARPQPGYADHDSLHIRYYGDTSGQQDLHLADRRGGDR
jgi:hypothetical protein